MSLCAASAGCPRGGASGPGATTSEGFSISYPNTGALAPLAKVGKHFHSPPSAQCVYDNGREARWTMSRANVAKGTLPPGLTLEDGVIAGVPTQPGTFKATIELVNVTCAGKPYPGQTIDVLITVK
jgi:hypothetical protein